MEVFIVDIVMGVRVSRAVWFGTFGKDTTKGFAGRTRLQGFIKEFWELDLGSVKS